MHLLLYPLIFEEAIKIFVKNFDLRANFELTVFELTVPDL